MLALSLTSIPPRFDSLRPTLDSLLRQGADAVFLCLPRRYRRFVAATVPELPEGVTLLWSEEDHGPATKLLPAAQHLRGRGARLIYCDDDWIYEPGWAQALAKGNAPVVAGSGFDVARLKRRPESVRGECDIAQGFAGVAVWPDALDAAAFVLPEAGFAVDDIWLSAQYARLGLAIGLCPAARALCQPRDLPEGLQDALIDGRRRAEANQACLDALTQRDGTWPRLESVSEKT